jgi:alpha-glucosidase
VSWNDNIVNSGLDSSPTSLVLLALVGITITFPVILLIYYRSQGRRSPAHTSKMVARSTIFAAPVLFLAITAVTLRGDVERAALGLLNLVSTTVATPVSEFTLPPDADRGADLLPTVQDPEARDPQVVCPGYVVTNFRKTSHGIRASLDLAGEPCNIFGNDIPALDLLLEYQAKDRLHISIEPRYVGAENQSWFILPEELISRPGIELDSPESDGSDSDLEFSYQSQPTFGFSVFRKSTGDTLFSTKGSKLIYEDQFIEFTTGLPDGYNLYGIGEVFRGFRLGNNLTRKCP